MTHTSTEQPEALRLADAIEKGVPTPTKAEVAAELRRLHARVQELEEIESQLCEQADVSANAYRELHASQAQRVPLSDEITDTERLEHLIAADAVVCEWVSEVDSTFTLMYATADMTLESGRDKTRYPTARAAIDAEIEADKQRFAGGSALATAHGITQEKHG